MALALLAGVFAGVGDRGVLDRGPVGVLGLAQPVVVPAQDGLPLGGGFVERGLAGCSVLAHPAAQLLVGVVVGEWGPGWLCGRSVVAPGGPIVGVLVVLHDGGGTDADVDGRHGAGTQLLEVGEDTAQVETQLGGPGRGASVDA
ncbi:hypothetical protein ACIG5E_36435 [Kitasatospora sp. NPDC053057]|uniref:hypothetical protein n=1 Tax=Kitasatospora sp. NPDC053057 TaxID=3364062 RepID=UPI0037C5D6A4